MQIIEILNFTVSSTVSYLELCLSGLTRMYTENFSAKKFYMKIIKSTYHIKNVYYNCYPRSILPGMK